MREKRAGKLRWLALGLFLLLCVLVAACRSPESNPVATPTATAVPATATPIPPPAEGVLAVEPGASLGPISPYLLGSNYGPWVAVPADMIDYAYSSGVQALRFPGGAWGDRNDLKSYHIDPFIALCEEIGAIPTISVRLREATPEQAADLVRYVNIEKEYGVVYWSIGNEPTLFAAELQATGKADDYNTVQYNQEWREFALAMKAVDPTIKLLGPEIHQFMANPEANPKDSAGRDWMTEFLRENGDLVDVITFHRYPFPKSRTDVGVTIEDLRQQSQEWEGIIIYLRGLIQEITGRDIPIAITEVNTHWNAAIGGEATPESHYNAVWLAEMVGRLMRQDVFMINHWMLAAQGGGQGGWGMIARGELRPSYYVYQLYSQFGTEQVYAESGVEDVSIYAALREDGTLTMIVVNLADTEQQVTLQVAGSAPAEAELWQLDAENRPEVGSSVTLAADGAMRLPAQSVSLFIVGP
jgi:hypothetical protein